MTDNNNLKDKEGFSVKRQEHLWKNQDNLIFMCLF